MSLVTTSLFGDVTLLPIPSQVPLKEKLSWLTDLIPFNEGSEETHQVRNLPRRRYDYRLPTSQEEYARAFNVLYGARTDLWAIPMWTEAQLLGVVTAGESTLTAVTAGYDFRDDSLALLWASPRDWQVVEIDSAGSGSLSLYGTTNSFSNAWLLPVRRGYLVGDVSRLGNGYNGHVSVSYEIEDLAELSADEPEQFLGDDIYFDEWLFSGSGVTDKFVQQVNYIDEQLGVVSYRSPWAHARISRPIEKVLSGPEDVNSFREFLYRRAGRYRRFWQPSFDNDLRVTSTGTVTDVLRIEEDERTNYAADRTHIAVQDSSGTWYARTVTGSAPAATDQLDLTLDAPINVAAGNIVRVSYLGLKRLESDAVDLNWVGGGVALCQIRVLEVEP